ncbi:hypothetical protein FGF80_17585 (plasmid) [Natrinema pallidum]|uniref:Uncharacterized protein n=1 Tax=Natrinema pallidum TaxID=69527 RepID=A0A4P9TLJ3_9EURY|nr:hypothetical protein FGF80_17585 [Natrinema pallidum]
MTTDSGCTPPSIPQQTACCTSVEQNSSSMRTSTFAGVTASQISSTVSCISTSPSDDLLVHLGNGIYDITRQGK